jgi:hypothetical protein
MGGIGMGEIDSSRLRFQVFLDQHSRDSGMGGIDTFFQVAGITVFSWGKLAPAKSASCSCEVRLMKKVDLLFTSRSFDGT